MPPENDRFKKHNPSLEYPTDAMVVITPNDDVELTKPIRAISVGVPGTLRVLNYDGSEVIIPTSVVTRMLILPARIKKVFATGTSATDIIGYV